MAMVNKTRLKIENFSLILVSAYIWNKNPLGRKLDINSITFSVQCLLHQQHQKIVKDIMFGSISYRRFTIIEDISLKFSVEDDDFHLNTSSLKISRNQFTLNQGIPTISCSQLFLVSFPSNDFEMISRNKIQ